MLKAIFFDLDGTLLPLDNDTFTRMYFTELSKAAIDYTVLEDYKTAYEDVKNAENEIVSCEYFTTSIYDLTQKAEAAVKANDSFLIGTNILYHIF